MRIIYCAFIAVLLSTILFPSSSFSQNRDSLFNELSRSTTDTARFRLAYTILFAGQESDTEDPVLYHKKMISLAQKQGHKALEAAISSEVGYVVYSKGNAAKGTEMVFKALQLAEQTGNQQAIGIAYDNLGVCFSGDFEKQKVYFKKALAASTAAGDEMFRCAELNNLSKVYLADRQLDSALIYAQMTYELALKTKSVLLTNYALNSLSNVHYALGNSEIAHSYLKKSLASPQIHHDRRSLIQAYRGISYLFAKESKIDSALYYAKKAYAISSTSFMVYRIEPARLLKDIYTGINSDSALKYSNIYTAIKDSLYSREKVQQMQLLDFEEKLRQKDLEEEQKAYIQFIAIGVVIISFALVFFLVSRSIIVPVRTIEICGVIGLLVLFEFINLLIHPFLEDITHHSPVLMLLGLVIIAGLIVPFHHKLEHWITHKMVKKNKEIKLARNKKLLEKLKLESLEEVSQ